MGLLDPGGQGPLPIRQPTNLATGALKPRTQRGYLSSDLTGPGHQRVEAICAGGCQRLPFGHHGFISPGGLGPLRFELLHTLGGVLQRPFDLGGLLHEGPGAGLVELQGRQSAGVALTFLDERGQPPDPLGGGVETAQQLADLTSAVTAQLQLGVTDLTVEQPQLGGQCVSGGLSIAVALTVEGQPGPQRDQFLAG